MTRHLELTLDAGHKAVMNAAHIVAFQAHPKGALVQTETGKALIVRESFTKIKFLLARAAARPGHVATYVHPADKPLFEAWKSLQEGAETQEWRRLAAPDWTPLRLEDLDEILRRGGDIRIHILDWLHANGIPFAPVRPDEPRPQTEIHEHLLQSHESRYQAWETPAPVLDLSRPGMVPRFENEPFERMGFDAETTEAQDPDPNQGRHVPLQCHILDMGDFTMATCGQGDLLFN